MREVPAMRERHPEDGIAGFEHRGVYGLVGLTARMRLDVRVGAVEQLLGTIDCELLGDIHVLATAVIALARIAFSVLVGEHRALCLQHSRAGVVLGSDELDVVFLTLALRRQGVSELWIEAGDRTGGGIHAGGEPPAKNRILASDDRRLDLASPPVLGLSWAPAKPAGGSGADK